MTVMVTDSSKRFHGAGSAGPFTWTWRFLANSDIEVYRVLEPDEADTSREVLDLLVEGVDYTLTGAMSFQGGSLTLAAVLMAGTDLVVRRATEVTQKVSIRNQGNNFLPSTHEEIFDRLTMMVQDRERETDENSQDIAGLKPRMTAAETEIDNIDYRVSYLEATNEGGSGSVIDFTGNGSAALQAAVNAMVGKVLRISSMLTTTATVNLPSHTHLIFNPGGGITNLTDNDLFGHVSDADNADISISGGIFEGNHAGVNQYFFHCLGVTDTRLTNASLSYFANGVDFKDCPDFVCDNNKATFGKRGILTEGTSTGSIRNNTVTYVNGNGIEYLATGDVEISGNKCWHCADTGIAAAGKIHTRMIVTNNTCCYNGGGGLPGALNEGINFHGLTEGIIANNITSFNASHGLDVNGYTSGLPTNRTKNTIVSGNVSTDNGGAGIILANLQYTNCTDNMCLRNAGNIIVEGVETYGIKVVGNNLFDSTGSPASVGNLHINEGGDILIENNHMGEIDSVVNIIKELWVTNNVTGKIMIGHNDFSKALYAKPVVIAAARTKVDWKEKQIFISDEIDLGSTTVLGATAYASDFSVGVDGWANGNGVFVDGNIDAIGGRDDTLRIYASSGTTSHYAKKTALTIGKKYRVTLDYYFPAGQTHVTGLWVYNSGSNTNIGLSNLNTTGAWTTVTSQDFVAASTELWARLLPSNDFTGSNSTADDRVYLKNITVVEVSGGSVEYPIPIFAESKCSCIWRAYAVYTGQTSAEAGVTVGIGKGAANHTYWATGTTGANQAVGSRLDLTINQNGSLDLVDYKPFFYSANNKAGIGKIRLVVEYLPNVPIYY